MTVSRTAFRAASFTFLALLAAASLAAAGPPAPGPAADSTVKPGALRPQNLQPLRPDLTPIIVRHFGPDASKKCKTIGWVMMNKGTASIPDWAYDPNPNDPDPKKRAPVTIRIFKMNPYMQVVMEKTLKETDPEKKTKAPGASFETGAFNLPQNFWITCSSDLNNNQWGDFQVRVDATNVLTETDENNGFHKVVPCWCQ